MKKLFRLEMKVILVSAFIGTLGQWGYAEDLYGAFASRFNLTNLNGKNGFTINGIAEGESWGRVGGIGDIDADGIDDIIVCGPGAKNSTGQCYVIFGSKEPWLPIIKLNGLDQNSGFAINGVHPDDLLGFAASRAGDVNGDGIADIILGAPVPLGMGQSYVLFGSKNSSPVHVDLANLNGTNGFVIDGIHGRTSSVSGAGDVNGDGIDDIIIGAAYDGKQNIGRSYVIFGKESWPGYFNLNTLNGANGFAINGIYAGGQMGFSVSGAGDVNGDGIADILIGAPSVNDVGQSYVVFGNKQRWPSVFNLGDLNGSNGFSIDGINQELDSSGYSVSGAGDVNGDGISDILIGDVWANDQAGQSYIIFGSRASRPANFKLASLNGKNGFIINGFNVGYMSGSGWSVSGARDVNGDGIDDIIIGAPGAVSGRGQTYVVFGSKKPWPAVIKLAALDGKNGFTMTGIKGSGWSGDWSGEFVSGAGDVNGDGINDILIGSRYANNNAGQSYVVFGQKE